MNCLLLILIVALIVMKVKYPDQLQQFTRVRYYKVGNYVVDLYSVGCYVGIIFAMYILWDEINNKSTFKGDCYGQPKNYRGNLPGRYSEVSEDTVNSNFFNRLSEEDRRAMDKNRF